MKDRIKILEMAAITFTSLNLSVQHFKHCQNKSCYIAFYTTVSSHRINGINDRMTKLGKCALCNCLIYSLFFVTAKSILCYCLIYS